MVKCLQTVYVWEVCQEYCAAGNLSNRYKHCYAAVLGYELQLRMAVAAAESISVSTSSCRSSVSTRRGRGGEGCGLAPLLVYRDSNTCEVSYRERESAICSCPDVLKGTVPLLGTPLFLIGSYRAWTPPLPHTCRYSPLTC